MRKNILVLLLAFTLLLSGCGSLRLPGRPEETETLPATTQPAETVPPATVPEDGNPGDVTCKGSYTGSSDPKAKVAAIGERQLTNEELAVWYWAAVAQYRENASGDGPNFSKPLDTQECPIDSTVRSWQQYFLKQALNAWHTSQALLSQAAEDPLVFEAAYQPNMTTHGNVMTDKPATKFLYGYNEYYTHNTMHQAFIDQLPEMLQQLSGTQGIQDLAHSAFGSSEQALLAAAKAYNEAYMYLTFLGYDLAPTEEEIQQLYLENLESYESAGITRDCGNYVDIRHILLIPEDDQWDACQKEAQEMLDGWLRNVYSTEATFAEMAYWESQDAGTHLTGGKYLKLSKGQLCPELDAWVFDPARMTGDTGVVRSQLGVHIIYIKGITPIWKAEAEEDAKAQKYLQMISAAKERFPMEVTYSSICLPEAESTVSFDQLLYPDIAHERYPEVPLYLQQDYPTTMFGAFRISSHGCGITTFSMLDTYMTDEEHTPPEMCKAHSKYSSVVGTDGTIFFTETRANDYFCIERVFDYKVAREALMKGYIVISLQHKGYWTRGGHYLLLEKQLDNGLVQVRDSNIANYGRIHQHLDDAHTWESLYNNGDGFWILEPKQSRIWACSRCGTPDATTETLLEIPYQCHKCEKALIRRNTYLFGLSQ